MIFLEVIFLSEYQSRRTNFDKNICTLKHSQKSLFIKNVPQFSRLWLIKSYKQKKILSICSFEYGIYWISPDTPRNSTTVITLLGINRSAIRNERRTIWWLTFNRHKPDNSWHSSRNEYISWSGISRYTQLDLTGYFKMHSI